MMSDKYTHNPSNAAKAIDSDLFSSANPELLCCEWGKDTLVSEGMVNCGVVL